MSFTKHPLAEIEEGSRVGDGSTVGAYSVLRGGAAVGAGCRIGNHAVLAGAVETGAGVDVGDYSYIAGAVRIGGGARIGPHVCISGEAGVTIGNYAVVEAGAVVSKNVPAMAVVAGNPATIVRYAAALSAPVSTRPEGTGIAATRVRGVRVHHLPVVEDLRGNLSFGEAERHVPFAVKRYFLTFDVANQETRGEHAHRNLEQFLLCVHGRIHIMADDGRNREEFILDRPNLALYLPPMVWGVQYRFSPGAVLLALCSDYYDPGDYIREYPEFVELAKASWASG